MKSEYCSTKKRLLAIILSLMIVFQMMPAGVLAEEGWKRSVSDAKGGTSAFRVTWTVDGQSGSYLVTEAGTMLSDILPASPSKEGDYRFTGWVDAGGNPVNPATTEVTGDISVTAVFEEIIFKTVTFTSEGDADIVIRVEEGETIGSQMPQDPSREGYRFDGWFSGENAVTAGTVVTEDLTAVAAFTELITVNFNPTTDPDEPLADIPVTVAKGEPVGDSMPAVPENPGYTGKWVISGTSTVVKADTVVTEPFLAVPAYEKITYIVTFVQENGDSETRTTDVDAGFAVTDLPEVTPKENQEGKWVYPGTTNEFAVGTVISEDLTVNAYYEQSIFTVTFKVGDSVHDSMTFYKGVNLILPTDPVKAGAVFQGWYTQQDGQGTKYDASKTVTEDLVLYAYFEGLVRVNFIVKDDDGNTITDKSQYFVELTAGSKVGTMPEDPFLAGKAFLGWFAGDTEITADTPVTESMTAVARFTDIGVYTVNLSYYYMNGSNKVEFGGQTYNILESQAEAGYTMNVPESSPVKIEESNGTTRDDIYYPSIPSVTVHLTDFEEDENGDMVCNREIEYVASNATYNVGYYLKNLNGNGYGLIPADKLPEGANPIEKAGVKQTKVTPVIKDFAFAEFESRDENVTITQESGQELKVYYTRKEFTLSYNTDGGEYIDAVTDLYGTEITLPTTAEKAGYTFAGWTNEGQAVSGTITLEEDTTLTALWNPANVNYKIVYMIENANDDGYSYLATVTKQAQTGTSVTMTAQTAGANGTRPADLDTTNFTFKDSTTETVAADGSTVVIVRYSRNVYTITWEGSGYELNNQGNPRWRTGRGNATLTAKYGADISARWTSTFNTPHPNWAWNFSTTNNDEKFTSLDIMPSGNKTVYHWYYSTTKTQTLNYWFENYEGTTSTTHNGKTYGLFKAVTVHYNYLYDTDYPDYAGYTKGGWVRSDGARSLTDSTPNGSMTADFYYNALQYPLTFVNYDGTQISTQNVTLNADISGYLTSNVPAKPISDAEWNGWFTDSEHQNPYTGNSKMPTGLILYGNFTFPVYSFTYDPQGGTFAEDGTTQNKTISVNYGETVDSKTVTKDNYTFLGWYTAAGDNAAVYDWNQPVTEDGITIYAHWTQRTLGYTVHYYEAGEDGQPVENPTSLLPDKTIANPQ